MARALKILNQGRKYMGLRAFPFNRISKFIYTWPASSFSPSKAIVSPFLTV
jgi:hypothetical protein